MSHNRADGVAVVSISLAQDIGNMGDVVKKFCDLCIYWHKIKRRSLMQSSLLDLFFVSLMLRASRSST